MNRDDRREALIAAATELAEEHGYCNLTREMLCYRAEVSRALINSYFPGGIAEVKEAVIAHAVAKRNYRIIAEAVLYRHPAVSRIKSKVREQVIAVLYPSR
jgi:AcrR family transcriptional regulator